MRHLSAGPHRCVTRLSDISYTDPTVILWLASPVLSEVSCAPRPYYSEGNKRDVYNSSSIVSWEQQTHITNQCPFSLLAPCIISIASVGTFVCQPNALLWLNYSEQRNSNLKITVFRQWIINRNTICREINTGLILFYVFYDQWDMQKKPQWL